MSDYPWVVLEIEPTSDAKIIRKAYAKLLRANRPEDDVDVFQRLVRARDFALHLAPQIELLPTFEDEQAPLAEDGSQSISNDQDALADSNLPELFGEIAGDTDVALPKQDALLGADETKSDPLDAVPAEPKASPLVQPSATSREAVETDGPTSRPAQGSPAALSQPAVERVDNPLHTVVTPADIAYMLQALDQPSLFASTRSRWAQIFDRAEFAPLETHDLIMALIVRRLIEDLRYRAVDFQNDGLFARKTPQGNPDPLRGYGDILNDFERHFRVLDEDKVLRRYLSDDDALYLIDALTMACGRDHPRSGQSVPVLSKSQLHAMPLIDRDFLEAVYRQDTTMMSYYDKCRLTGRYESSFSWFALLFPLPWAMCHRLIGLAWLFGVLLVMCTGIAVIHHFGRATEIDELVPGVYISISIACALQSHRLRLQELARAVVKVQSKGGTHQSHIEKVHRVMHRSRILAAIGFLIMLLCLYAAVLYGLVFETRPL